MLRDSATRTSHKIPDRFSEIARNSRESKNQKREKIDHVIDEGRGGIRGGARRVINSVSVGTCDF